MCGLQIENRTGRETPPVVSGRQAIRGLSDDDGTRYLVWSGEIGRRGDVNFDSLVFIDKI